MQTVGQKEKKEHAYAKTLKEARERGYWFKAKTYGYGWVPTNVKGWVATLCYTLLILQNALSLVMVAAENNTVSWQEIVHFLFLPFLLYSTIFYLLTVATGEPVKWRW